VFRGEGETTVPLGLTSLEAVRPAPIGRNALRAALEDLTQCVSGAALADEARLEAIIRGVIPAFRHIAAEARLDDRI
jgi:hypothetical protein